MIEGTRKVVLAEPSAVSELQALCSALPAHAQRMPNRRLRPALVTPRCHAVGMNDTTETPETDAAWAAERLPDGRTRGERRADNRAADEWAKQLHERDAISAEEEDGVFTIRLRDGRVYRDPRAAGASAARPEKGPRPVTGAPKKKWKHKDGTAKARFVLAFGSCLSPSPRVRTEGVRLLDEIRRADQEAPNP